MIRLNSIADLKGDLPKSALGEITVVNRIEAFLEDMNVEEFPDLTGLIDVSNVGRRTGVFHSSMIGSQSGKSLCGNYPMGCGRELYYSLTDAESEGAWQPRIRRILDTGTAIHTQLQLYLKVVAERFEGFEFEEEADIDPDVNEIANMLDISGHTDGICVVTAKDLMVRFGLEIKSINANGYKETRSIHAEHIMQGTVYQKCLDLPFMLFLYYNKNDSQMAEFVQVFDHKRWDAIEEKLNIVRDAAIEEDPPPQEPGYQCSRCKYQRVCDPPKRQRGARSGAAKRFQRR